MPKEFAKFIQHRILESRNVVKVVEDQIIFLSAIEKFNKHFALATLCVLF
eukprot:GAFH01000393.1.p5 GENE.GAFH01000393.1~~GAFH01000393.1.p5  ORF type:complete len:50 (+),score=7.79 GAFH01000393.1:689-838(+)